VSSKFLSFSDVPFTLKYLQACINFETKNEKTALS